MTELQLRIQQPVASHVFLLTNSITIPIRQITIAAVDIIIDLLMLFMLLFVFFIMLTVSFRFVQGAFPLL